MRERLPDRWTSGLTTRLRGSSERVYAFVTEENRLGVVFFIGTDRSRRRPCRSIAICAIDP
jgi:hypothetical protein